MERNDVVAARNKFLREIKQVKQSSHNIVYLDEIWVNQNYTDGKCWTDTASPQATGVRQPKGNRLILLHAGTKNGFVNNAELVFQAKNDGDSHNQMNSALFEEWFRNQLLPNISPNSVIVMDNASYHSAKLEEIPTSSWRKSDLQDWLMKKGVQPHNNLLKAELHELAKRLDITAPYVIDKIAEEAGHRVLRLPSYHCQYNPIELIWAQVKTYITKKNNFKMADLKSLVKEALSLITPQIWMEAVRHAEQVQDEDAQQDIAAEHFVESFVVNVTESSDDEDCD
ncbi:uncharacterized protein LOC143020129 [Oratosquilla oratoria]|uniref:uncharacterized protein LOC143020129 n=1 Tax=Oratosquilla oratoria TaxID=337810 RepID=UPI003F76B007